MGNNNQLKQKCLILAILGISSYCCYLSLVSNADFRSTTVRGTRNALRKESQTGSSQHQNILPPSETDPVEEQKREQQCTIYVAPSSLKGNPGYGVYTTRNLWKGEKVLGGPDGVSIPVEMVSLPDSPLKKQWIQLWNAYWWGRGVPDHAILESGPDMVDFQIGFGYLPNHHCELSSLDPQYPEHAPYDDSLASRFESPGAGAFSYNIGREFSSTRDVQAGEELFMSYGYCRHGQGPKWTKDVYMPAEFNAAADILWRHIGPKASESFSYDESDHVIWKDDVIDMVDSPTVQAKLVRELLPETKKQVQVLAAAPLTREDLPKYLARTRGINPKTPDWIRTHGMCLDTLVANHSTIPHAGQGGFAKFSVRKGEIIAMAPVLHIMDKDVLTLQVGGIHNTSVGEEEDDNYYHGNEKEDGVRLQKNNNFVVATSGGPHQQQQQQQQREFVGTQLLLNYCFSNPHSTVLLCPTTNAVLINHCSIRTKQCGPNGPNADYRWSSGWDPTSDEWREQSLEELAEKKFRGLSLEMYALRDIAQGEEVFIDYGEAWEHAWAQHVQGWKPPPRSTVSSNWITAKEANEKGGPILQELVLGRESKIEPVDHPYLMTGCVYMPSNMDYDDIFYLPNENWKTNLTMKQLLKTYASDGSYFEYHSSKGYASHADGAHWPCSVWFQQDDDDDYNDNYVVQIHPKPTIQWGTNDDDVDENGIDKLPWVRNQLPRILVNYPRNSIRYFVKQFAGDQHLPGVFRQPIGMRDDLFPKQWMNIPSL